MTNQPIAFGDANHRRTTQAAAEATARVQRALQVLGPDIPEHLLLVGRLRLDHPRPPWRNSVGSPTPR